jgi:putative cell wall-binding protein
VVEVTPEENGIANFTMLASQPGEYPLVFKLMDSHGIPMPEELTHIQVVRPEGVVILTGDDFLYSTVASLCSPENKSVPTVTLPPGKLSDKNRENLQTYAKVIILGNESMVPAEVEGALAGAEVKRIVGANLCEATWRFTAEMWQNGTTQVVLSSPKLADVFKAYQVAKLGRHPLVICDGPISDTTKSTISDLISRNDTLSKALTVGVIGNETIKTLQGLGVSIEEVAQ